MIMSRSELERINFMVERDGLEAAKDWALKTLKIYRSAVIANGKTSMDKYGNIYVRKTHFASTRQYRERFIRSYLELKRFVAYGI